MKSTDPVASRRYASWCVGIGGAILSLVGVAHDWFGLPSLHRAVARGEIASRLAEPQMINWAFSGGAISTLGSYAFFTWVSFAAAVASQGVSAFSSEASSSWSVWGAYLWTGKGGLLWAHALRGQPPDHDEMQRTTRV